MERRKQSLPQKHVQVGDGRGHEAGAEERGTLEETYERILAEAKK